MRGFTCTHKKRRLIIRDFLLRKKNGLLKIQNVVNFIEGHDSKKKKKKSNNKLNKK